MKEKLNDFFKVKIMGFFKENYKLFIIGLIAIVLGLLVEVAFNLPVLTCDNKGITEYNVKDLGLEKLTIKKDQVVIGDEGGVIHIPTDNQYVDKVFYSYHNNDPARFVASVVTVVNTDAYGNPSSTAIQDNNPYRLEASVINVREKATEICLSFDKSLDGVTIDHIYIQNSFRINQYRFLFFASIGFILLCFFVYRELFTQKVENMFLVSALVAGTLMVIVLPYNKVGFDEEAHFRSAYKMMLWSHVSSADAIEELTEVTMANWPFNLDQSIEERDMLEEYFAVHGDYTSGSNVAYDVPTKISSVAAPSYVFMAVGIKFAKLLHLPFGMVYMMGRLFNMWMYVILIYFAIKKVPVGKRIMAVVALMPTAMFQAAVYSYDSVVTGFIYLGLAYLLAEILDKEKKLTIKNGIIILGALSFGCLPKAVYVPLVALGFMIAKDKFKNNKERIIFRIANIVCIFGLLFTFVLPMLVATDAMGDTRGGAVSVSGQISTIVHHPLGYLSVWLENVGNSFTSYMFGEGLFGTLGHLSVSTCTPYIAILIVFVILADFTDAKIPTLSIKQKGIILGILLLTSAFVWGSMYLAFNEVAAVFIGGVQGRYFIPLMFLVYLLFHTDKIKNTMNLKLYNTLVFSGSLYILLRTIYDCILQPYCF